ncbi:hypothetical protein NDU88_002152 [Pleurodeles waltl]|uniref:Uncharacterized protein n=1 Tax=Pleurodeles waltl TaxID=8319 RepID=A0AAV7RCH5_PLEWA|nr:hypothetical protein NDU88_002152 [Pleurodeles waltl]
MLVTMNSKSKNFFDSVELQAFLDGIVELDCSGASSVDAIRRCPRGTSTDDRGHGDTSSGCLFDPEALDPQPRNTETPDDEGPFKAPEDEE